MTARVIVVGAGITGLTAAYRLRSLLPDATITVVESDSAVGGKIRAGTFAGLEGIDEGADAFLTRAPSAIGLADELGLTDQLTSPAVANAQVWWNGLHDIPEGLLLGVPTGALKLARSPLLSWSGKARAALEPLLPATGVGSDCVGKLIRKRFGKQVHERLVDPLIGSIYAADTDHFSLAGVPQILDLATNNRSLLLGARSAKRHAPTGSGPIFATPRGGIAQLTNVLAQRLGDSNVEIILNTPVEAIERTSASWLVNGRPADAIVLAAPAQLAAVTLRSIAPGAAATLQRFTHAGVVIITMAIGGDDWPDEFNRRSGYLVPKPMQKWVTAVSFGSSKWAHWNPSDGTKILRVSLGRDGRELTDQPDQALTNAALSEVGAHLGIELNPHEVRISRWPLAFPQYRPGHAQYVEGIDRALISEAPGIFLAGASYRGIGIPACIADATKTAAAVTKFVNPLQD